MSLVRNRTSGGGTPVARLFGAVARPLQQFLRLEAASGLVLLGCAASALIWANVDNASYRAVFDHPITLGLGAHQARFTLLQLANDGLMTLFFFVVGMEIKRELVSGELDSPSKAILPAFAALGGMILPAAIFLAFTWGTPAQVGWGIPIATDIAFCVGVLTLLKGRVSRALVVFVTALAIFDDIGGILVIAVFYGNGLSGPWLLAAAALGACLAIMNRSHVINGIAYGVMGIALWYTLHHAGIHPTIAGVVLGLSIPASSRRPLREVLGELAEHVTGLIRKPANEELDAAEILMIEEKLEDMEAPLTRFAHLLHPAVAFGIMPLFALANSGIDLSRTGLSSLLEPVALGAALGLFVGKQLGIFGFTTAAVRTKLAASPGNAPMGQLFGVSIIGGIGFTVSLFIASLAFGGASPLLDQAKLGILVGSLVSGLSGYVVLRLLPRPS